MKKLFPLQMPVSVDDESMIEASFLYFYDQLVTETKYQNYSSEHDCWIELNTKYELSSSSNNDVSVTFSPEKFSHGFHWNAVSDHLRLNTDVLFLHFGNHDSYVCLLEYRKLIVKELAIGGNCACKVDLLTSRPVINLVYSLSLLFESEVIIDKPESSSPSSHERYLIFKNFKGGKYSENVVVPLRFLNFISESNAIIGSVILNYMLKPRNFYQSDNLIWNRNKSSSSALHAKLL